MEFFRLRCCHTDVKQESPECTTLTCSNFTLLRDSCSSYTEILHRFWLLCRKCVWEEDSFGAVARLFCSGCSPESFSLFGLSSRLSSGMRRRGNGPSEPLFLFTAWRTPSARQTWAASQRLRREEPTSRKVCLWLWETTRTLAAAAPFN